MHIHKNHAEYFTIISFIPHDKREALHKQGSLVKDPGLHRRESWRTNERHVASRL